MLNFRYIIYIFFLLFLGKGVLLKAQSPWGNVYIFPNEKRLRLNLEISAYFHSTQARSFSKKQSFYLKDGGQASNGLGSEIMLQHRFRKNSLWAIGVLLGYQNLAFENSSSIQEKFSPISNASHFYGKAYNATYLMPNIAFRAGVKWKFELNLALGLAILNGGANKEELWTLNNNNSMTYTVKDWYSTAKLTKGYRLGASVGYLIQKRFLIALHIGMINLSGKSTNDMREINHIWNIDLAQIQHTINDGFYTVKRNIKYQSYFFGLTLKYTIYKTLYPHTKTKNGIIYH